MKLIIDKYRLEENIPVGSYLKNKKSAKYFNRETAAAVVCAAKLISGTEIFPQTPIYYACERVEFEDYGLETIIEHSLDDSKKFNSELFIADAMPLVSPLSQFKVLYNMPLSFISIENGLTGDNAVLYHSGNALIQQVICSGYTENIIIGAGKVYENGDIESAFALIKVEEAEKIIITEEISPIELFYFLNS